MKYDKAEYITFYANRLIRTNEFCNYIPQRKEVSEYQLKPTNMKYTGLMTKSGAKIIEKRLTGWINSIKVHNMVNNIDRRSAKTYPVFITLTLPDQNGLSDKEVKKDLLELLLKRLIYNGMMIEYFWKAEKQKRGTLHFHLITDRYVDMKYLQTIWNDILRKKGILNNYYKIHKHYNAPSTHIRSINDLKNSVGYVMKYVSKYNDSLKVDGRLYSFSKKLSTLSPCKLFYEGSNIDPLNHYLSVNVSKVIDNDYYSIYYLKDSFQVNQVSDPIKRQFIDYYLNIYDSIYGLN